MEAVMVRNTGYWMVEYVEGTSKREHPVWLIGDETVTDAIKRDPVLKGKEIFRTTYNVTGPATEPRPELVRDDAN